MKILIYEPGRDGHRPVYRHYIQEAFEAAGCGIVVVTESFLDRPISLANRASKEKVDIVFVCTFDGLFGWLVTLGIACRLRGVRLVGIYYLFNNLYSGWKGYLWRGLLQFNIVHTIFVPDLKYESNVDSSYRHRIRQIPDAWDSRVHKSMPRETGLTACGIADVGSCVFLVLGAISRRKGLDRLLSCVANWDYVKRPKINLLVSGKVDSDVRVSLNNFYRSYPGLSDVLIVKDSWLSDQEICQFYAASSYLCAIYPKSFTVSISTVIRAFAVGRPVIVGDHGMVGEIVKSTCAGIICNVDSPRDVLCALQDAYDLYKDNPSSYDSLVSAGAGIAAISELKHFQQSLSEWIRLSNGDSSR